ncbi:MAG TPA: redoxin domain-containing protein [Gemmata sp.]
MRYTTVAGLLAGLAALAGCGASNTAAPPLTLEQDAALFQTRGAERGTPKRLPERFTDATGREIDLAAYRGKSNVVLVVVKGFSPKYQAFCPGCLAQVGSLVNHYDEFQARGAEVLLVFPGARDTLDPYLRSSRVDGAGGNPKVPFPILLDPKLEAVEALGVRSELANPSTFILDRKGDVVFGYVGSMNDNYDRPSVKALLAQLDKINDAK